MSSLDPPTAVSIPPEGGKPADHPCLLVLSGPQMGRSIDLGYEALEIGRSTECALALNDDLVSRRHARIKRIFGGYFVTDLESANGTYVNGQRITMAQLADGDQIRVGQSMLKFVVNQMEAEYSKRAFALATIDPLTGAHNKRHFDETLAKEAQRALQQRTALSLILIDIDHFKKVNDTYGHPAGDLVLKGVVERAKSVLGPSDVLCRVGGEELAVIATKAGRPVAVACAERIRTAVERDSFDWEGRRIAVTVSAGVAELGADEKLYASKRAGRNRVS
jgi:diguanylate cyclase (GGDEF)-like protein